MAGVEKKKDIIIPEDVVKQFDMLAAKYKKPARPNFTEVDDAILLKYWGRVPQAAIFEKLKRGPLSVKRRVIELGMADYGKRRASLK
jgi:hypothetical protein